MGSVEDVKRSEWTGGETCVVSEGGWRNGS